ncbi:hypothetical protein N3K66_001919 [Trichothecium roseum]|uniref:Uncharacterized protein n=1 Tax=Trichothecium roseum TaxID=47278 RepID=A0ACC0V843_9HYPO|nr:hypothetical protein N3K66_001919 [Trichothecium roseum]
MTVKAIPTIATGANGVGSFILQCKKIELTYCEWGGSSRGMIGFIKSLFPRFAAAHPQIEFSVSPRPGRHPVITGHYINGRTKPVCVRNEEPYLILKKMELLRDANGEKLFRTTKPVHSEKESVRGIWSPYHGRGMPV